MNYPKKELLFFLYTFCIAVHTATLTISLPLIVSVLVITLPSSKEHDIKSFSNTQKETITFLLWEIMRHYGPPWHKSGWLNMLYFTMLLVSWKLTYLACQTQCGGWYIWHMGVSTAQQRYNMLRWHICHTSALGAKRRTSKWVQHIKRCRDRDIRCTLYGGLAGLELVSRTSLTKRWSNFLFHTYMGLKMTSLEPYSFIWGITATILGSMWCHWTFRFWV